MKIDPSARLRTTPLRRAGAGRGAAPAGEFASHLSAEPTPAAAGTAAPLATNPLLSLQEIARRAARPCSTGSTTSASVS